MTHAAADLPAQIAVGYVYGMSAAMSAMSAAMSQVKMSQVKITKRFAVFANFFCNLSRPSGNCL